MSSPGSSGEGGWGLSSEHDEESVQEVDTRSVDLDRLQEEHAKHPGAPWRAHSEQHQDPEQTDEQPSR